MPKSGTLQKLGGKKKEDWQEVAVTLDERGLAWESQGAGGALRDKVGGSQKLLTPDQLVSASPCSILGVEHCFEVASTVKGGKVYKFSAGSDADADAWLAALEQTLSGGAPAQTSNPLGSPGPAMEVEQAGGPGVAVEPSAPPPELAPPADTSAVAALETTPGLMLFGKPISKQVLGAALVLVLICVVVMASGGGDGGGEQTDGGDAAAGSADAPSNPFGGRQNPAVRPPPPPPFGGPVRPPPPPSGGGRNPPVQPPPPGCVPINLDQLPGVVATCTGCNRHSDDSVGGAAATIDMDHSPDAWTSSPHSGGPTCSREDGGYVTIDLGAPHSLTGVTIWHYYGNDRAYCSQKVAISVTGAFAGEETVVYDTGTCSGWCTFPITCDNPEAGDCTPANYGPTESVEGNSFSWSPTIARYVRHWSSRGQNAGVHFIEIDVYGCEGVAAAREAMTDQATCSRDTPINLDQLPGVSVALGTTVDSLTDARVTDTSLCASQGCDFNSCSRSGVCEGSSVIDMSHAPSEWTASPYGDSPDCSTRLFVTIDLGAPHSLTGVTIWHYYGNDRAYCSQKIAVSVTGAFDGEETVVYDTGACSGWCTFPITCENPEAGDCTPANYGPTESEEGNSFSWAPTVGRYVRHWSSRGQNTGMHFMEIDVYGCEGVSTALDSLPFPTAIGDLELYMNFDNNQAADMSGARRDGVWEGTEAYGVGHNGAGRSAQFDGASRIAVPALVGMQWGNALSVSCFFRRTGGEGNYQGIVNNGYYSSGSFEIRMGREGGGTMLGGGVITESHAEAWDHVGLTAGFNEWHHVALVYDGRRVLFFLDGQRQPHATDDSGAVVSRPNSVFIGQAGTGTAREYFEGLIDEVKIWTRALGDSEVAEACACRIMVPPPPPPPAVASGDLDAWYSFDADSPSDDTGNGYDGTWQGTEAYADGRTGRAASFDGSSRIVADGFRNMAWGDRFAVSVWFKRNGGEGNYQGIVSNGYYTSGSFEIRMGREGGGTMLGGGVITAGHGEAWDHVGLTAGFGEWHHVALIYDDSRIHFYLDGAPEPHATQDDGDMLIRDTPLFIGQAGTGTDHEYFVGLIDEVKIFTRPLTEADVANECGCTVVRPPPPPPPSRAVHGLELALTFDDGTASDSSGMGRDGVWEGTEAYGDGRRGAQAARFDGSSRIVFSQFIEMKWGNQLSVSCFFKRISSSGYQGIVNNGYYSSGSFEIRMGDEGGGTMLGGGVLTAAHPEAWDHVGLTAAIADWHHVALVYSGSRVDFWLDGTPEPQAVADTGTLMTRDTPVFVGQAGTGKSNEYFNGLIDEVRIYTSVLGVDELADLCGCVITPAPPDPPAPPPPPPGECRRNPSMLTTPAERNPTGVTILSAKLSTDNAAGGMLSWNFEAGQDAPAVIDGVREPIGGHEDGQHDEIVAVQLSATCAISSFTIYGTDREVAETDLRHVRVAASETGTDWSCSTLSYSPPQGGPPFAPVSSSCGEGPSHAPSGAIFELGIPARYVEFAFWGRTDIHEIELQSCQTEYVAPPTPPAVEASQAIDYARYTAGCASEMLLWDFSTAQPTYELIDGDRSGTGVGGGDLIVGVRLTQRCATSAFAVHSDGELQGVRVAHSVGGSVWSCWVRRDGDDIAQTETDCSEGASSAPSGSVFYVDYEAEFVQFAVWGDSVIKEVELVSCTPPAHVRLEEGLVAHLHMDSSESGAVTDSSPFGNHCQTSGAVSNGQFCRGLSFNNDGPQGISIASGPSLEFGMGSFSVMGWAKFEDYTYPRTSFVAKNGHGCYFHRASEHSSGIARAGWNPGWEIGHGFNAEGSDVCIRDSADQKARAGIRYDAGSRPLDLQGQWAHYAFVFDRTLEDRVFVHINGVRQHHSLDISAVTGSVENDEPFTIGTLYGWKTDGTLDEYRLYNRALSAEEVRQVYAYVPPMAADCPPPPVPPPPPPPPPPCVADTPFEAEIYFGTELPAGDACTGAEGHGSDGENVYCVGDTATPVLDDGMGFSTGRDGGMDYGWDCAGDTNVDFSAGRRAPPRETYGLNHFDRYGECVGSPTNWNLALPNGAYEVAVDFAADSRGWDGEQCSELHVGEDAVAFLTVENDVACSFRPGCMFSDVVIVNDGKLTITGYSHTVGGGTCHSIAFVKVKTYVPPPQSEITAEFYFGTEFPADNACTGAGGHDSEGHDVYCFGDTATPILDDGTGFSTGRVGGMDYGWDCDGDTNVDFSAGRRAPPRETYGMNHFDRYGECVGKPTNWNLALPNGAYQVAVDFAADSRGWDGEQCSELHVGEEAANFLEVESELACPHRPGCMFSDVIVVTDGKLTITGYSHTVGGGTCHSIAFVKVKTLPLVEGCMYIHPATPVSDGLVVLLHMDEEDGGAVTDWSNYANTASTQGDIVPDGKYCRGRHFTNDGPQGISIPSSPILEFGSGSFSVMGWAKFEDYTYPRTSFVAKNGHGCYFHRADEHESGVERAGWNPGWEIGHGYVEAGANVCIRDGDNNKFRSNIEYDVGSKPSDLLGRWAHYAFVFDRDRENKVFVHIDGVRQQHSLDISGVPGSVDNGESFTIGTLYGWKTDGTLDEYRMYNRALSEDEVRQVYAHVPPAPAGC